MYDGHWTLDWALMSIISSIYLVMMDRALMRPISLIFYRYDGQGPHASYILDILGMMDIGQGPHAYYILYILGMMDRALMRTLSYIF